MPWAGNSSTFNSSTFDSSTPSWCVQVVEPLDQVFPPLVCTTENGSEELGAPIEEVAIEFPGVADTAMQLDHFLTRQLEGVGGASPRAAGRGGELGAVVAERPSTVVGIGARQLDLDVEVGEPMLDCL